MNRLMISVVFVTISAGAARADEAHFVFPGWARYVPSYAREALTVADFNEDEIPDIALIYAYEGQLSILDGQPDGSLGEPRDFPAGPGLHASASDMAAADLVPDANGLPDLIVGGSDRPFADVSLLTILRNLGPPDYGFVVDETYSLPGSYLSELVALGDFDGDGMTDIAHSGRGGNVYVRYAQPGGGFGEPLVLPTAPWVYGLASGDFDIDGRADLVVRQNTGVLILLYGTPDQGFDRQEEYPGSHGGLGARIAIADFDGNGLPDIAVGGNDWTQVHVYYAREAGGFDDPQVFWTGPRNVTGFLATGDIDGDGRTDLVASSCCTVGDRLCALAETPEIVGVFGLLRRPRPPFRYP